MKTFFTLILGITLSHFTFSQACTPAGDQIAYGTSNVWIGYIYDNIDFTNYGGYVNEGTTSSPNFDENFGGDYVNYPTNGCSVYTETFSARYKLTQTFASGQYQFMVGGDDGYRLSIDGGATWIINRWGDQSYNQTAYSTTLSGTYNIVLEYYENGGGNRVSFSVAPVCVGTEDQSVYGTAGTWRGYIYTGTNFNTYSGFVTEGGSGNPNFDESFGGDYTFYNTSACGVLTELFSARYRLQEIFTPGNYLFTVGGDDGYRLSVDGGSTWVIDNWGDHGYTTSTYNATMSGSYNMVLEYYENAGGNRVSFNVTNSLLPFKLISFNGSWTGKNINLNWKVSSEINADFYGIERSADGTVFSTLGKVNTTGVVIGSVGQAYSYTDLSPLDGLNYYRMDMVDKDGNYTYSPVIKIQSNERKIISVFPSLVDHSPVWLTTNIELKNGVAELYDMTGKKLQVIRFPSLVTAGQTISLSLQKNLSGSYLLICKSGAEIKAKQIIIFK